MSSHAYRIGVDIGGTFTDIVLMLTDGTTHIAKVVSTSEAYERGKDPRDFALFAFGGNGGLFAAEMARELEIARVMIPPSSGIFFGLWPPRQTGRPYHAWHGILKSRMNRPMAMAGSTSRLNSSIFVSSQPVGPRYPDFPISFVSCSRRPTQRRS